MRSMAGGGFLLTDPLPNPPPFRWRESERRSAEPESLIKSQLPQTHRAICQMTKSTLANTSSFPSPYFREEHEALRAQVRRFVETEIKPHALAWEEQGYVPREVLRRMGELGFLGIRYPAEYGG